MNQEKQRHCESGKPAGIRLRAHHLLCLQGFQGYGYSQGFTANLARIVAILDADPGTLVELVAENDDVCACCPHAGVAGCQKDPDAAAAIRSMDAKILMRLNLEAGYSASGRSLWDRVNAAFKTRAALQGICGDCRWREQCLWYQKRAAE
ncbi:hypothetical protein EDC14_1001277 [Hydrogenispora ethanolica]|jgi:hypothetical protein|uniref:DUF1284 domain-containing protein n=1 Tax=Hydrogenispora ethanolica TaxID=1082276 RepID=A0A4R1SE90_HYDET|nr:DUF1284 domain-containing protein [Hydrogenispora ethanolica]TCL76992.1 hypothetical protein EDC14_1001277 [Hydrogenispora ethanolica]